MNGLINEWCADHWVPHFQMERTQQPLNASLERYVVKGGSWFTESDSTRSAARSLQPVQRKVMVWGYESYGNLPIRRNEVMDDEHANLPLHTMFKIPASIVIS